MGTSSEQDGSFVWSWANEAIPPQHGQALEVVPRFWPRKPLGVAHHRPHSGRPPRAMECMCIAARLQRAVGTFMDQQGDVTLYFTLLHLQVAANDGVMAQQ